jgi:4-amino-4-deoxy-L-arabinose transferase-like glycosyltransferase
MIVDQIHKGFLPTFNIRTPGYPLFLTFMFVFFKSNLAVIAVQNLFTLFSSLFFIFVINKIFGKKWKYLALLVAIGLGAFVSLSIHLCLDTALATESIYINTILLFFSFLLLAIYYQNRMYWVCCGITMAMVILIRPSGLFLVPLFLAILLFLFLNAYKKKLILLFSISFVTPLILICIYNYFTIGSFAISTFTEHALISFTSTFLEKNPDYSPQINRAIEKSLNRLSPHKKNIIKNSWDPKPLSHILLRHYNRNRRIIFQTLKSFEDKNADNLYMKWRPVLKKKNRLGCHP